MKRNLLRAKIVENGLTMDELADKLEIHRGTLYYKMSGRSQFTIEEAMKMCDLLHIESSDEKAQIFLS